LGIRYKLKNYYSQLDYSLTKGQRRKKLLIYTFVDFCFLDYQPAKIIAPSPNAMADRKIINGSASANVLMFFIVLIIIDCFKLSEKNESFN
jgi:hypothetical protein